MKKLLFILTTLLFLFVIGTKAQTTSPSKPPDTSKTNIKEKVESPNYALGEHVPEFPGGIDKFARYLRKNFRLPDGAEDIKGRVIVSFVIEKDGSVTEVKVTRGLSSDIDKEAIRVITACPKWHPGNQYGKPVRVAYSVPIPIPIPVDF